MGWLKNRTPTAAVAAMTPMEVITGTKPDLSKLLEWGCRVWVHTKENLKLDARAVEGRWVGYNEQSKGSWIYWLEKRSVMAEWSITFAEPVVVTDDLQGEDNVSVKNSSLLNPQDTSPPKTPPSQPVPMPTALHLQRIRRPSQYVRDI